MTSFGPWNPGIHSQVPRELQNLITLFRPENAQTTLSEVEELRDLTGLEWTDLVLFRPQRLALHEVMVRVMANLSVSDGSSVEDLGINFRRITSVILARYVDPQREAFSAAYADASRRLTEFIERELTALYPSPTGMSVSHRPRARLLTALFGTRRADPGSSTQRTAETGLQHQVELRTAWEAQAAAASDSLESTAYRALARVLSALLARHGCAWASRDLISLLATRIACNDFGSEVIGRVLEPVLLQAASREGYSLLPRQERPVIMNTKGPSASGKSTIRPLQRALAGEMGIRWSEFALVSPDIWRKQLLDYRSLGEHYKYGAACTGDEVRIIDQKLDRYMAGKAQRGDMSHLMIDRFRFDSFAPDSNEAGSNLLTRFGHTLYLFFMITPPASLVERAWKRGLEVGRFKAVDDTLAHCVEAYAGMPNLFFTWVHRTDKQLNFEFLDNSVIAGQRPRTVAFGSNDVMNVLDIQGLVDLERFRRINVAATAAESLYPDPVLLAPEHNTAFIKQCAQTFSEINFAEQSSGRIFAQMCRGKMVWLDQKALTEAARLPDVRAGLTAIAPEVLDGSSAEQGEPRYLRALSDRQWLTLGQWGDDDSDARR